MSEDYAIIQLQGKQHLVKEGDTLVVDRLQDEKGKKIAVSDVLFQKTKDKYSVGQPLVKAAKVTLEVVDDEKKGEKIRVAKFRSKSRYRKVKGHRQQQTVLKVLRLA